MRKIITMLLIIAATTTQAQTNGGELSGRNKTGNRMPVGVDSLAPSRAALMVSDSTNRVYTLAAKLKLDSLFIQSNITDGVASANYNGTKILGKVSTSTPGGYTDGRLQPLSLTERGELRVTSTGAGLVDVYVPSRSADVGNYVSASIDTFGQTRVTDSIVIYELQTANAINTVIADNSFLYDASNNDYLHHISDTTSLNYNKLANIESYSVNLGNLPLMRDTIGKIYNRIPSGLTVNNNRLAIYSPDSIRVFATNGFGGGSGGTSLDATDSTNLAKAADSTYSSRRGVVLLANPTIANTTFAATQSGTWTVSNDSTGMSRKGVVLLANPTITNTTFSVTPSGTFSVTVTGHDSTTDSRKGVVLLANPTITNDSTAISRKGVVVLNTVPVSGTVTSSDSTSASRKNVQVTNTVATTLSGHDSTTDSRKGVVLLTNPSVQGTAANNAALSGNPVNIGAQGVTAEPTAITADRQVQLIADVVGKLITSPYANSDLFISGSTNAITDTTSTSVIAAAGSGVRNYITSILVTNSHATVSTFVKILDGTTTLWQGYALAAGGGFSVTFPVPLKGTANTAINAKCVTTGSNVIVNCAGYKGR